MLSRDLWDSVTGPGHFGFLPFAYVDYSLGIPNHELIDSSALGYDCLEKISDASSEIEH